MDKDFGDYIKIEIINQEIFIDSNCDWIAFKSE